MATHIPVFLPGKSPWTEEPGGPQSMASQRVGHDRVAKRTVLLESDVACGGFPFLAPLGLHCCAARSSRGARQLLSSSGSRAHGLGGCHARAQSPHSMWNFPGPGIRPVSPALPDGFLTTGLPGKPLLLFLIQFPFNPRNICIEFKTHVFSKGEDYETQQAVPSDFPPTPPCFFAQRQQLFNFS